MVDYKNILFCTDFSEDAHIAFVHALNLARKYGAWLHILHIPHSPFTYSRNIVDEHVPADQPGEGQAFYDKEIEQQAEKDLREAYAPRLGEFDRCSFHIACGAPDVEIVRYARRHGIDLIVMGALGRSSLNREGRGSTVARVSKYAHCHVMAIRNPARQFTLPGEMVAR